MTSPLSPALMAALRQSTQGGILEMYSGTRVYPQFFCCISGNTVGVYKDPVAVVEVSATDVCTHDPLHVHIDHSFSASSTLALWSVDWDDGNISNGAWPPGGPINHPTGGYLFPGIYTIELEVTDMLGATGVAAVDVVAEDCEYTPLGLLPGEPPEDLTTTYIYCTLKTDIHDYYTDDITASPPAWTQVAPPDSLEKTCMMHGAVTDRLFGYGYNGIWEYQNLPLGGGNWTELLSDDDVADEFGHLGDYWGIYVFRMQFSERPEWEGYAWAGVCLWYDDAGTDHYMVGVLHTEDEWASIIYATELFDLEDGVDWDWVTACETEENALAIDLHNHEIYVLCGLAPSQDGLGSPLYDGWWRLYRSQSLGANFVLAQDQTFTWGVHGYEHANLNYGCCDVWIPWVSDDFHGGTLFWTAAMLDTSNNPVAIVYEKLIFRSDNSAASRLNIGDDGGLDQGLMWLKGPWNNDDRVFGGISNDAGLAADQTKIWTWRDGNPWSEFRDTATPTWRNCYTMMICSQDGVELESCLSYEDPYMIESGADENKACTEEEVSWFTVVL